MRGRIPGKGNRVAQAQRQEPQREIVWTGHHVSMWKRGHWEYAVRNTARPAVGIVAVTSDDSVVLVEQYRPPVGERVIEIPAGLVGDLDDHEEESLMEAAKRELFEETGYTAERWIHMGGGYSSPGLTDETIELFFADGLRKEGPGGGDDQEEIRIHEVPWNQLHDWLGRNGAQLDLKLLAGIRLAERHRESRSNDG